MRFDELLGAFGEKPCGGSGRQVEDTKPKDRLKFVLATLNGGEKVFNGNFQGGRKGGPPPPHQRY